MHDARLIRARNGNSHCFIEFLEEMAAQRALCCSGALLGKHRATKHFVPPITLGSCGSPTLSLARSVLQTAFFR